MAAAQLRGVRHNRRASNRGAIPTNINNDILAEQASTSAAACDDHAADELIGIAAAAYLKVHLLDDLLHARIDDLSEHVHGYFFALTAIDAGYGDDLVVMVFLWE